MCVNTQKYYMAYINAVYNTECNMVCSMQELFLNLIMQMQLDGVLSFTFCPLFARSVAHKHVYKLSKKYLTLNS